MLQQQTQESRDLDVRDVGEVQVAVESEAFSHGTDSDRGDRRDLFVTVTMKQDRGLSPGAHVLRTVGVSMKPLSSRKAKCAISRRAFS
jgi:hypothetical protein